MASVLRYVKQRCAELLGAQPRNGEDSKYIKALREAWTGTRICWLDENSQGLIPYGPDLELE